jgi:hypothetical protein
MKSIQSSKQKAEPPATLLCPRNPEILKAEMQPVQLAIARRAFELFEKRGSELGPTNSPDSSMSGLPASAR